jgi:hypothetical protein
MDRCAVHINRCFFHSPAAHCLRQGDIHEPDWCRGCMFWMIERSFWKLRQRRSPPQANLWPMDQHAPPTHESSTCPEATAWNISQQDHAKTELQTIGATDETFDDAADAADDADRGDWVFPEGSTDDYGATSPHLEPPKLWEDIHLPLLGRPWPALSSLWPRISQHSWLGKPQDDMMLKNNASFAMMPFCTRASWYLLSCTKSDQLFTSYTQQELIPKYQEPTVIGRARALDFLRTVPSMPTPKWSSWERTPLGGGMKCYYQQIKPLWRCSMRYWRITWSSGHRSKVHPMYEEHAPECWRCRHIA